MAIEGVNAFPLEWPDGWVRTEPAHQKHSAYKAITVDHSRVDVLDSLRKMGVVRRDIVLSTNLPLRKDGEPYGDARCQGSTGVAVYWMRKGKPQVIACDRWTKVGENTRAIWHALEALRSLERCGASQILERAFMGFAALPAAGTAKSWREVLFGDPHMQPTGDQVERAFLELAKIHHPDKDGGSTERFAELSAARVAAREELG